MIVSDLSVMHFYPWLAWGFFVVFRLVWGVGGLAFFFFFFKSHVTDDCFAQTQHSGRKKINQKQSSQAHVTMATNAWSEPFLFAQQWTYPQHPSLLPCPPHCLVSALTVGFLWSWREVCSLVTLAVLPCCQEICSPERRLSCAWVVSWLFVYETMYKSMFWK